MCCTPPSPPPPKQDKDGEDKEAKKEKAKGEAKALKKAFEPLTSWWKEQLGAKVSNVKLSKRLASTPAVVVASKWGQSAHMEKIMKASVSGMGLRLCLVTFSTERGK